MKRHLMVILLCVATAGYVGCSDDGGNGGETSNDDSQASDTGDADVDDAGDARDADRPDARDADDGGDDDADDGGDADGGPDADIGSDVEGCDDGDTIDSDGDGLYDCEEETLCTDPHDADTDNDGLNDRQELREGTDPCDPDSDDDGLEDGKEIEYGLDPNDESTFDDGVLDGDRWIVEECEDPQGDPLEYSTSTEANWKLALASTFDNNRHDLDIEGASIDNRWATSVYESPTIEVSGFLMSEEVDASQTPQSLIDGYDDALDEVGTNVDMTTFNPQNYETHDFQMARTQDYLVELPSEMTVNELREALLFEMAPFEENEVDDMPSMSGGSDYDTHRVTITVIRREYAPQHGGDVQSLASVAIAPAEKYEENDEVGFRMDDLTNTTNVATQSARKLARCDVFQPSEQAKADFFWVLDQSTSMNSPFAAVQAVAADFGEALENTTIDYRLGVTTMDQDHKGRLIGDTNFSGAPGDWDDVSTPGWHSTISDFTEHVQWVRDCMGDGSVCNTSQEYGLETARKGIEYMKHLTDADPGQHAIRDDAELITIWMTDEEDNEARSSFNVVNSYGDFMKDHTTAFAIAGTPDCEEDAKGYRAVAEETGGTTASICREDEQGDPAHGETIKQIIDEATIDTAQRLFETPISSSLRVNVAERWVPRSEDNGFNYYSEENAVAFYGDFRPEIPENNEPADPISVTYETFGEGEKELADQR
ncbi:MAG: hypothetical protein ACOCV2_09635 [Persicimonas sp.]